MSPRPISCTLLSFMLVCGVIHAQESSTILNGREYLRYPFYFNKGSAYFQADSLAVGSVLYDGVLCSNVGLLYDQMSDELITSDYSKENLVGLVKEKVDSFTINGHRFINIRKVTTEPFLWPEVGYYETIHTGKIMVLKKDRKSIKQSSSNNDLTKFIETHSDYYVFYKGRVHKVRNMSSFLSVFGDKKKELRQFVNENDLNFRRDPDATLARTTAHIESSMP